MLKTTGAFAFLTLIFTSAAPAFAQTLTGEMASSQYLAGTWDCSVTAMMPTGGSQQQSATLTMAAATGNVLSQTITSPTFMLSGFFGYNTQLGKFYSNTIDNMGGFSTQTATRGGTPGHTVWTGTSGQGGPTVPSRSTDDKISDTKIHHVGEVNLGGTWTKVVDATCTKH